MPSASRQLLQVGEPAQRTGFSAVNDFLKPQRRTEKLRARVHTQSQINIASILVASQNLQQQQQQDNS